jgi:purine-binding chemotaxis protein CheW
MALRMLVISAGGRQCALPIEHVVETMRPLPLEPVGVHGASAAPHVMGVSIIRGEPLPVLDLGALLSADAPQARATSQRYVTIRVGARRVALAVTAVHGVREVDATNLHEAPPLLRDRLSATVTSLGALDRELVAVLDAARLLQES